MEGDGSERKTYMNLFNTFKTTAPTLNSRWLPFWNMQTTSRLYSAELQQQQQQLTPHHYASQTGSLLSEPFWGGGGIISNTKLCVCTSNTRGKLWLLNWGGGQARVSLCAPKKPKHFLFGPELIQNMERNYWMAEWLLRTIIAVIRWNSSVVSYDSHVVGVLALEGKKWFMRNAPRW